MCCRRCSPQLPLKQGVTRLLWGKMGCPWGKEAETSPGSCPAALATSPPGVQGTQGLLCARSAPLGCNALTQLLSLLSVINFLLKNKIVGAVTFPSNKHPRVALLFALFPSSLCAGNREEEGWKEQLLFYVTVEKMQKSTCRVRSF